MSALAHVVKGKIDAWAHQAILGRIEWMPESSGSFCGKR
jgi:hypothetical protein